MLLDNSATLALVPISILVATPLIEYSARMIAASESDIFGKHPM